MCRKWWEGGKQHCANSCENVACRTQRRVQLFLYIGLAPISHKMRSVTVHLRLNRLPTAPPRRRTQKVRESKRLLLTERVKNAGKAVAYIERGDIIHVGGYHTAVDRARHLIGLLAEICRVCSQKTLYFLIAICYNALNYKKMEEASGIIPGI